MVVQRLPLYVRALSRFHEEGVEIVSSEQLGASLHITPAQIRKDLSYFGRFGKQGRGYDAERLAGELRGILGLDQTWNACLVGVGRLGRAIIRYPGFELEGFAVRAVFDADPALIGTAIGEFVVEPLDRIAPAIETQGISIGIVAVPASHAQDVIDLLVDAGVRAILNYAPVTPTVPKNTRVRNIDPVLALQSMTYYLKRSAGSQPHRR